ncbi:lipid-transfer protein [Pseudomaricurvus alkylphenolicus]|uniref:lipid-transfer protein n=1 Tax=Pseudomaricurvus alkylphenolicus TaxID=1306991 RepID=UPI0014236519|nr:lipid-transfer protein [Pseudomaricurvus alkylphenolicus]NIB41698.1 lipid-transfer protein [Pseudomaricurvus alkylphenolicus]
MANPVVAGVDMVKFVKPGTQDPYRVMASTAINNAMAMAGIEAGNVDQAYASYVNGDSTAGQHALYDAFQTGIPVINVNNNCASGSTALFLARQAVASGAADCVLAFGFEEMQPGALGSSSEGLEDPISRFAEVLQKLDYPPGPPALQCFGAAGSYYMDKYGAKADIFAKVAVKTRNHAVRNPYSLFSTPLSVEEVASAPVIWGNYLTRLMACPPTCGAAAAIVVSQAFAQRHGIKRGVEIIGQAMTTDTPTTWSDPMMTVGYDMTRRAAQAAYEQAGVGPESVQVVELHDCFTPNEVITYEALGLCDEGEATALIERGDNTYGGKYVVNPSGGLMSKGHPVGATGLAQCFELFHQLQHSAADRQVDNANIALQHNVGLGGAAVVTMYKNYKI